MSGMPPRPYGPMNPNAPRRSPLQEEADRTGRTVEELQAMIQGSNQSGGNPLLGANPIGSGWAPPALGPNESSIGPDNWANNQARMGRSEGAINEQRAFRNRQWQRYGSAEPGYMQMVKRNIQNNDDMMGGNPGLTNAAHEGLMFAGASVLPAVAKSSPFFAPARDANRVVTNAIQNSRFAGPAAKINQVAKLIDPNAARLMPWVDDAARPVLSKVGNAAVGKATGVGNTSVDKAMTAGYKTASRTGFGNSRYGRIIPMVNQFANSLNVLGTGRGY